MATPDTLLLERWQRRRDADAFAELVQRHSGMVFACCKRILRDPAQAEDVAQECFVALMQTRDNVRASLAAWLHRIAVRRSIDRLRSDIRRRKRETTFAESQQTSSETDIAQSEILARVDEAIAELPDEYKSVIIGRFLENRTHADLAEEFGVAESTLRHRLKKGVDHIRESLHKQGIAAAFATVFAALEQTADAVPPKVIAQLNKLAVSGSVTAPVAILGAALWMKAGIAALLATLIGAGIFALSTTPEKTPTVVAEKVASIANNGEQAASKSIDLASAAAATPQPPSTSSTVTEAADTQTPFSIEGRVYDAVTGQGIANVKVELHRNGSGRFDNPNIVTNEDGQYRAPQVPDGTYYIGIREAGPYVKGIGIQKVNLQNSQPVTGIDFPLQKGYSISGSVLSADGQPVPGADVRVAIAGKASSGETKSSENGSFVYYLSEPADNVSMIAENDSAESAHQYKLAVTEAGLEGLVFVLDRPKTASITGVVVDEQGNTLDGARLSLHRKDSNVIKHAGTAEADAKGAFTIANVASGDYAVVVAAKGVSSVSDAEEFLRVHLDQGEEATGVRIVFGDKGGMSIAGRVVNGAGSPIVEAMVLCKTSGNPEIARTDRDGRFVISGLENKSYEIAAIHKGQQNGDLIAAGTMDAEIVLRGQGSLSGRVVRADSGQPLTSYTLAYVINESRLDSVYASGKPYTSDDGAFSVGEVPAGTVTVAAWAPGFAPALVHVEIDENQSAEAELRLETVPPFKGLVVNAAGEPVSDAAVYFVACVEFDRLEDVTASRTDANGQFTIESLPKDAQRICAYRAGYGIGVAQIPGDNKIILPPQTTLEGVVQRENGAQDVFVAVSYMDAPHIPSIRIPVAPDGAYRVTGLTPGTATVTAVLRDSPIRLSKTLAVKAGQKLTTDFTVTSGTAQVGGTLKPAAESINTGTVELIRKNGDVTETLRATDAETNSGQFQFDRVWAGDLVLKVKYWVEGQPRELELPIVTQEGQTLTQDIDLSSE